MPVWAAGPRVEMATSLPRPSGDIPAAIAADSPPLEPPGVRSGSQGLRDVPTSRLAVSVQYENSGKLVLAKGIPPAARNRATAVASASATRSRNRAEPRVVTTPA